MITLTKKSLAKLTNLETLYFSSRALAALEKLPEEIRNNKCVKDFSRCYKASVVNIEKKRSNPQTIELNEVKRQVELLFKALTRIVYAEMYHPDDSIVQNAGAANEILSKYRIMLGNNTFKIISKIQCQIEELESLGKDVLKSLNIDAYIVAVKLLLEKHSELFAVRGSHVQSNKGLSQLARNDLNVAWSKLVDFIVFYNVYVAPESCDEFMLIVNELFSKCKKRQFDNSVVISNS